MERSEDEAQLYVVLAEYVSVSHNDGTSTVIRGWIDRWTAKAFPHDAGAYALLDVPVADGWTELPLKMAVLDPDGKEVMSVVGSVSRTAEMADATRFQGSFPLQFRLEREGSYKLVTTVGKWTHSLVMRVKVSG